MRKNRLIDIDGTICTDISNENSHLFPYAEALEGAATRIKQWYDDGDFIVFFTSREEKDRQTTSYWLEANGFKFHGLVMNKPRGGNYFWLDNLKGEYQQFTGDWEEVTD